MDVLTSIWAGLGSSYGQFFSLDAFLAVISDPVNWSVIVSLVILEGLLSADNALVLAVMVKHLPGEQKKKALFYGILGAYLFRFIAIGVGVYLIKIWWVKALGALYLLWLSAKFFFLSGDGDDEVESTPMGFWRTVLAVEIMDIAFSMDSVLAAFGVSDKIWVLYLGGVLGVLMMRGVAQIFIKLIDAYPELEATAYVLIALIGAKMMGSVFGLHLPEWLFFVLLTVIFVGTIVLHHLRPQKSDDEKGKKAA